MLREMQIRVGGRGVCEERFKNDLFEMKRIFCNVQRRTFSFLADEKSISPQVIAYSKWQGITTKL